MAAEPPEDWKWLMPYRALILPVTALAIVAIVASSVWLILSWVQKCAALVAAMDSRKLRKAA